MHHALENTALDPSGSPAPRGGASHRRTARIRNGALAALAVAVALAALLVLQAGTAYAAPPNDDFANAIIVPGLPYTDTEETADATTEDGDPDCFGNGPTVWYSFTPTSAGQVLADTSGSFYDTTLSIYTGSAGNLTQIACNDDNFLGVQSAVRFDASPGVTYSLMVGAYNSGPGGHLVFNMDVGPPPLTVEVEANPRGTFNHAGEAVVSGTVLCSQPAIVLIQGSLQQTAGRFSIFGFYRVAVECDRRVPWSAESIPDFGGLFRGGHATLDSQAFAYSLDDGAEDSLEQTVLLQGAH